MVSAFNMYVVCVDVCAQSCLTLCNPMDCSPPASSDHGIFQAMLEWVALSFSRGSSHPGDQTRLSCVSCVGRWIFLPLSHLEVPAFNIYLI